MSASADRERVCPLLSAVLNFSPRVLSSRLFHDWWLIEGNLTEVYLAEVDLTRVNLLLAVVVTLMTMLLGLPLQGVLVVTMVTMMPVKVTVGLSIGTFFFCCCTSLLRLVVCCFVALLKFR